MQDLLDLIKSRRSVRKYLDTPIPKDTIDKLIEAAIWAPTGMNHQPWGFLVIQDRTLIDEISSHAIPYINEIINRDPQRYLRYKRRMRHKGFNIFYHAPCVITVLGRKESFSYENDCAMAAQNMMLLGWSMGIGSCWIGMMKLLENDSWFRDRLGIPEEYSIVAPLAFGYCKTEEVPSVERRPPALLKYF